MLNYFICGIQKKHDEICSFCCGYALAKSFEMTQKLDVANKPQGKQLLVRNDER